MARYYLPKTTNDLGPDYHTHERLEKLSSEQIWARHPFFQASPTGRIMNGGDGTYLGSKAAANKTEEVRKAWEYHRDQGFSAEVGDYEKRGASKSAAKRAEEVDGGSLSQHSDGREDGDVRMKARSTGNTPEHRDADDAEEGEIQRQRW